MEPRIVPLLAEHLEQFTSVVATFHGKSGRGYKIAEDIYHFPLTETRKKDAKAYLTEPAALLRPGDTITTIAPPTDVPFKPSSSINFPAAKPVGFLNIHPALGAAGCELQRFSL